MFVCVRLCKFAFFLTYRSPSSPFSSSIGSDPRFSRLSFKNKTRSMKNFWAAVSQYNISTIDSNVSVIVLFVTVAVELFVKLKLRRWFIIEYIIVLLPELRLVPLADLVVVNFLRVFSVSRPRILHFFFDLVATGESVAAVPLSLTASLPAVVLADALGGLFSGVDVVLILSPRNPS